MNILFLGYSKEQTALIGIIENMGYTVIHSSKAPAELPVADWHLVISYGYRHILSKKVIDSFNAPVINLHISYLPYNRGAHPNFWAFHDNTPHGVTIHEMDAGIDTGPIIFQKEVVFDAGEETFSETYNRLVREIEDLFIRNINTLLSYCGGATPQQGKGTYHNVSDLPPGIDWNMNISECRRKGLLP